MNTPICGYKNCDEPACEEGFWRCREPLRLCQAHLDELRQLVEARNTAGQLRFGAVGLSETALTVKEEK